MSPSEPEMDTKDKKTLPAGTKEEKISSKDKEDVKASEEPLSAPAGNGKDVPVERTESEAEGPRQVKFLTSRKSISRNREVPKEKTPPRTPPRTAMKSKAERMEYSQDQDK